MLNDMLRGAQLWESYRIFDSLYIYVVLACNLYIRISSKFIRPPIAFMQ